MAEAHGVDNWLEFDRYAVYGLGRSGRAACRLLTAHGKRVVASDLRGPEEFDGALASLPREVELVHGENDPADADAVVLSPGLEPRLEVVDELRNRSIPFFSEVDLAHDAATAPILAVTGTDGKTTTTAMLGEIARASKFESTVGGNIGTPLSDVVGDVPGDGVIVAEVSAFQLWSCHHLRPAVGGYTNIADDHLDYFESRRDYARAKHRLERNAKGEDWMVYNLDDERVAAWSRDSRARRAVYGLALDPEAAVGTGAELVVAVEEGAVVGGWQGERRVLFERDQLGVSGAHNLSNAMCASAMGLAFGMGGEAIREGIAGFEALPHRVERVGAIEGVAFINDSKATNVHSALAGLESIDSPYVAIVGGVDKGLELEPLCEHLVDHAAGVVVIGAVADRLEAELRAIAPDFPLVRESSLEEATQTAFEWARRSGETDCVVLSPACSSFDMFDSYEDRGETFRRAVDTLRDGG